MSSSLGGFRAALVIGWIALSAAGVSFARAKSIPISEAWPVILAFLLEYPFYLAAGFPAVRERVEGARLPFFLVASAVLPYLACCCGAIPFEWTGLMRLTAMALALSLWYIVLPVTILTDLAFLSVLVLITLGKFFDAVYPDFHHQKILILGHAALIQISVLVLILERRVLETGYGFVPSIKDFQIGFRNFVYFAMLAFPLAIMMNAAHFVAPAPPWIIAGTFLGALWFVALSEEFFFRGVLQPWIADWTWSHTSALIITSLLYGLVHISFHHEFPNWRWVLITSILGWFCGRARNETGNIRAAMVTHSLVVATYAGFLK